MQYVPGCPFIEYENFLRKIFVVRFNQMFNDNNLRKRFLQNLQEISKRKIIIPKHWYQNKRIKRELTIDKFDDTGA